MKRILYLLLLMLISFGCVQSEKSGTGTQENFGQEFTALQATWFR